MANAHESLSIDVMKRVDAVCDRFEADWKAGKKPAIEKALGATTGPERAELLRMLLKLELELRGGAPSSQDTYEARFPDDTAIPLHGLPVALYPDALALFGHQSTT